MRKFKIGFNTDITETPDEPVIASPSDASGARKSVVQVYFPTRGMNLAYYNDRFDLKVGDAVYVDGKLEGHRGRVTQVSYCFKIRLSDYKRVIAVVDTDVKGDLYLADSHLVTFDQSTIPFEKVLTWFKAPQGDEEYVSGSGDGESFLLDDLSGMNIRSEIAERGHEYYVENKVVYLCIDGTHGHAIVEGGEAYEVEFEFCDGEISGLTCSCFCSFPCKHEFAAMLQLRETLEKIAEHYDGKHNGYFAAISKNAFMNMVMNKKGAGKISMGV